MGTVFVGLLVESKQGDEIMTPTILIFLKAPVAGQVKTRLAREVGDESALEIYRRLVDRQMSVLPGDWPVEIHYSPAPAEPVMRSWLGERSNWSFWPQVEADLGERLAHATKEAFSRGAQATLLIGGDCPELGGGEFRTAADALRDHEVVLGPSPDGGYYLLGTHHPHQELFQGIEWGTETVAASTRAIISHQAWSCFELSSRRDVDTLSDWKALQHLL